MQIPLFSLPTQRLIVQEIEKQFSRLDEGLDSLKKVKENLKKYKASVLKSAVEGKLTKDWREYQENLETASKLLERILEENKRKFLEENPKKKYKEPEGIKEEDVPEMELPEGWCYTSLGNTIVSGPQNGLYKPNSYYGKGDFSILRIDDYQYGWIKNKEDLRLIELNESEKSIYSLEEYDFIINRVNSMTHLGKVTLIKKDVLPCVFESNMMRIKFSNLISVKFIEIFLMSSIGIKNIQKNAKQAVNQASINQGDVKNTILFLPPLQEQNQIVKIVEEKLSVVEKLEKIVEENIKKAENLKQSILKKAFEGRLVEVPENEEEEVEKLLEEITTEKARMEQEEKQMKRGMRKKK